GVLKRLIAAGKERLDLGVGWAPDGAWIASGYTTNFEDFYVDILRPDGSAGRQVFSVLWSPDGSKVAYATSNGLFVGPSNWRTESEVTSEEGSDAFYWAADGSRFIFVSGSSTKCPCSQRLQISSADGTGVHALWTPPSDGIHDSWIENAALSPTGDQIAVDATINNGVADAGGGEFLYL